MFTINENEKEKNQLKISMTKVHLLNGNEKKSPSFKPKRNIMKKEQKKSTFSKYIY